MKLSTEKSLTRQLTATFILCVFTSCVLGDELGDEQDDENELNELEEYVLATDESYSWQVHSEQTSPRFRTINIELTSQNWLTEDDVDRTEWTHWISLIIPDVVFTRYPLIILNGDEKAKEPPEFDLLDTSPALLTSSIVAYVTSIPNQPLTFHEDEIARTEDDLIAYAWSHLLDTDDMRFIPQAPMVKATIRAIDVIAEYMTDSGAVFEKFVLVGGSELSHVVWLTAAMDDRVAGFSVLATDVLNIQKSLLHQFASYGYWAEAMSDYVYHNVVQTIDADATQKLLEPLDPINYTERLQAPKLLIHALGDEHGIPDSTRFYWDDLEGDNYLRYLPNAGHSLNDTDQLFTIVAFHRLLKNDLPLPEFSWRHNEDGTFEVSSDLVPTEVRLWQGTNAASRDFRLSTFGENFSSEVVEADADGSYRVEVQAPDIGWTAYMMELNYDVGGIYPLKLTTQAYVIPDEVPYPLKEEDLQTSITLLCDATDSDHVSELTSHLSEADASTFTDDALTVETRGIRLYINWNPKDASTCRVHSKSISKRGVVLY